MGDKWELSETLNLFLNPHFETESHRMRAIKYLFLIFCLAAFFSLPSPCFGLEKIFYMSKLREEEGIESLKKYSDKIDIIAPQMYGVNSQMNVAGGFSAELKSVIKEKNLKAMPLVANSGFSRSIMHSLLTSGASQQKVIDFLIKEAKEQEYIGWQFDFENISFKDRDLYSNFVEKTAGAFKKQGLVLSIAAVVRKVDFEDTDFYKNWSGAFDYARLARAADFISVMTYDDPSSKGPCASLSFVKESLDYLKDKIPPEKLSMGVPLYYWGWSASPLKKVRYDGTYSRLSTLRQSYKYISDFYEEIGVPWFVYFSQNRAYIIWYEDARSFALKLKIAEENNLRGFSAWVLGVEDPGIWEKL